MHDELRIAHDYCYYQAFYLKAGGPIDSFRSSPYLPLNGIMQLRTETLPSTISPDSESGTLISNRGVPARAPRPRRLPGADLRSCVFLSAGAAAARRDHAIIRRTRVHRVVVRRVAAGGGTTAPLVTANQSPIFGKCFAAGASIIISLTVLLPGVVFGWGLSAVGRRAEPAANPIDASFTTAEGTEGGRRAAPCFAYYWPRATMTVS